MRRKGKAAEGAGGVTSWGHAGRQTGFPLECSGDLWQESNVINFLKLLWLLFRKQTVKRQGFSSAENGQSWSGMEAKEPEEVSKGSQLTSDQGEHEGGGSGKVAIQEAEQKGLQAEVQEQEGGSFFPSSCVPRRQGLPGSEGEDQEGTDGGAGPASAACHICWLPDAWNCPVNSQALSLELRTLGARMTPEVVSTSWLRQSHPTAARSPHPTGRVSQGARLPAASPRPGRQCRW